MPITGPLKTILRNHSWKKNKHTKPRSLGPCLGGVWPSQMRCHQPGTRTIGTWWGAEQRGWQQALSSGKYMRALGAGGRVHVPLQSLRNCSLTESGRFRGDFLQAESAVLPKGTKLYPSKCILSPIVRSWGMLLRGLKLAEGHTEARPHGQQSQVGLGLGAKPNFEHRWWRSWPGEGFAKFPTYVCAWEKTGRDLSETAWRAPR